MATASRGIRPGSIRRRGERKRRQSGSGASLVPRAVEKPWRSRISVGGKVRHIGYYATKELAREAYIDAARHLGLRLKPEGKPCAS
jgi:hypothetical protein